jgi:hypothetical protein
MRLRAVLLALGAVLVAAPAARADDLTDLLAKQTGPVSVRSSAPANPLKLVRSFDIPRGDEAYDRLANLSFTYDNALAVLAYTQNREYDRAAVLLRQLQTLQAKSGAIDFSYDVRTGRGSIHSRMNAMAWVGIAAVAYRKATGSEQFDPLINGLADYVLRYQRNGLVPGGPDVTWISTQQNLLVAEFLRSAGQQMTRRREAIRLGYEDAAKAITEGLFRGRFFLQGVGDADLPLDAQVLGSMFLWLLPRGADNPRLAVNAFIGEQYWVDHGAWTGFRPYAALETTSPNIVWTEGTLMVDWMLRRQGSAPGDLRFRADAAVAQIEARVKGDAVGPPAAETASNTKRWGEYPAWPATAPVAWLSIIRGGGDVLFSP